MRKLYVLLICIFAFVNSIFGIEDSLQKAIEIGAMGAKLQSERLKIAAENLANEDSVSDTPGGKPYQRKRIFAKNTYDKKLKTNIVSVKKYDIDKASPFVLKYEPTHPAADFDGYVKYPNVQREIERADSSEAQRSYEANLSIMEMSKNMINKTLEIMR